MAEKIFRVKEVGSSQEQWLLIEESLLPEVLIQDGKIIQLHKLEGGGYVFYEVLGEY